MLGNALVPFGLLLSSSVIPLPGNNSPGPPRRTKPIKVTWSNVMRRAALDLALAKMMSTSTDVSLALSSSQSCEGAL